MNEVEFYFWLQEQKRKLRVEQRCTVERECKNSRLNDNRFENCNVCTRSRYIQDNFIDKRSEKDKDIDVGGAVDIG
jgi:hypothetical protein